MDDIDCYLKNDVVKNRNLANTFGVVRKVLKKENKILVNWLNPELAYLMSPEEVNLYQRIIPLGTIVKNPKVSSSIKGTVVNLKASATLQSVFEENITLESISTIDLTRKYSKFAAFTYGYNLGWIIDVVKYKKSELILKIF